MSDKDKSEPNSQDPFLTKEDLIKHLAGQMMPAGKKLAPSLVMWGDPHGDEVDIDALEHLSAPEDQDQDGDEAKQAKK
ncbi:MAG: hypothetical protein AAF650_11120 [Pseudomonadota bacterium]